MQPIATADRDPFPNTADPAAYVPRTATEAVLVRLEMALREGARVVSLGGPEGAGKTLLLRVLVERLAGDFRPVLVPYPKLAPDEFCQWGLFALGEPSAADPEEALTARLARSTASATPLLWLVDDAACMPPDTLRCLLRLQASAADLRVLLVRPEESSFEQELARARLPRVEVQLEGEMGLPETARYVRARLDRAGVDPAQRALFEGSLERLYELSGGNPGRLHAAAAALVCFGEPATDTIAVVDAAESLPVATTEPGAAVTEPPPTSELIAQSAPAQDPQLIAASETSQAQPAPAPRRRRLRRLRRR